MGAPSFMSGKHLHLSSGIRSVSQKVLKHNFNFTMQAKAHAADFTASEYNRVIPQGAAF